MKLEDIDDELLFDLRNKMSPILNLCTMIQNGDNSVYNNPIINNLLNSEVQKVIDIVKTITKTKN